MPLASVPPTIELRKCLTEGKKATIQEGGFLAQQTLDLTTFLSLQGVKFNLRKARKEENRTEEKKRRRRKSLSSAAISLWRSFSLCSAGSPPLAPMTFWPPLPPWTYSYLLHRPASIAKLQPDSLFQIRACTIDPPLQHPDRASAPTSEAYFHQSRKSDGVDGWRRPAEQSCVCVCVRTRRASWNGRCTRQKGVLLGYST